MNRKLNLSVLALLTASALGSAYANNVTENDALAVTQAKITLTQAIASAEHYIGGKASKAEYETHAEQGVYAVEVIKDKTVMDVLVNSDSGKIIAATADKADHDEEEHDD